MPEYDIKFAHEALTYPRTFGKELGENSIIYYKTIKFKCLIINNEVLHFSCFKRTNLCCKA